MVNRRMVSLGLGAALAAPLVMRSSLRAQTPRIRRDVMDMPDNDPFFTKYADAVAAMHAEPASSGRSWMSQALIHPDHCRHGEVQFLHWHRHYLDRFERICAELIGDPDFSLPYWNWNKRSGVLPNPFFTLPELTVEHWNDSGVYNGAAWGPVNTIARRGVGIGEGIGNDSVRGGPFSSDTLNTIRGYQDSTLFFRALEGTPHGSGHVRVGALAARPHGHMQSGLSSLDPIFWLHHCMVDCMWAEWQSFGNITPDPNESFDDEFYDVTGAPAGGDTTTALDVANFGYTYDILDTGITRPTRQDGDALSGLSSDVLREAFEAQRAVPVGGGDNDEISVPEVVTPITVTVDGLADQLQSSRIFRQSSATNWSEFGIEGRRLVARLSDIKAPENDTELLVNVFINCPYLAPDTPYTDPFYAGTFSFFGRMAGMHHGLERVIDLTAPVRALYEEGRIRGDELTVQLMAVPAAVEGSTDARFSVPKIEIVST